jgi:membrane protease YdiL (CAAX protease family)
MNFFQITGVKKSGLVFSATVVLFVILSLLIQGLCGQIMPTDGVWYKVVCALISPLSITVIILVNFRNQKGGALSVCGFRKFKPLYIVPALLLSVGMIIGFGFINDLVSKLFIKLGLSLPTANVRFDGWWSLIVYLIAVAVIPAVFEESLFRGAMLNGFERKNALQPILFIAVCFALYHGSITQFVYQLIYGVMLTALAYKSGSALPSMIAHFINNALVLVLSYFGVTVDFYNPVLITVGVLTVLGVATFLVLYDRKTQNQTENASATETPYKTALGFWVFAIMGVVVTVTIIVGNLMV